MTEETPTQEGIEASYNLGKNLSLDMLTELYNQAEPLHSNPAACLAGALEIVIACTLASAPSMEAADEVIKMAKERAIEHNRAISADGEVVH
jgi:hypothetical protein